MSNTFSPIGKIQEENSSRTPLENSQRQRTTLHPKTKHYGFTNKNSSLVSVDQRPIPSNSYDTLDDDDNNDDQIRKILDSSSSLDHVAANNDRRSTTTNERQCSLTQMLLVYAQQEVETLTNLTEIHSQNNLNNILNVLELHFNTYADDKRQIYFEGIFQILHDFKEQITEFALIETMQLLQINPLVPCSFENFVLILCHLPPIKQDYHVFLDVFNELDYNKDSYVTFEDIQFVLPHLTSHFNEEIIRAAIHTIDTDHDNDRLSYFDFVTSLIALQECKSAMKTKPMIDGSSRMTTEQK